MAKTRRHAYKLIAYLLSERESERERGERREERKREKREREKERERLRSHGSLDQFNALTP